MTLLMCVGRKGWPLESVTVELSHERVHRDDLENVEDNDRAFIDQIKRQIVLRGDLTDEQGDRIAFIARRSPLHRTLESKPRTASRSSILEVNSLCNAAKLGHSGYWGPPD